MCRCNLLLVLRLGRPGSVIKHITRGCVPNVTFNYCALLRLIGGLLLLRRVLVSFGDHKQR